MRRECSIEGCSKQVLARGLCSAHYRRLSVYGSPTGGGRQQGLLKQFAFEASTYSGDECVIWPFGKDRAGYGRMRWAGRDAGAHQVVCELAHGPRPTPKHEAAHSCGMGHTGCVSPTHLRWATHKENHSDRAAHGTNNAGESCGSAKLTEEDVLEIRRVYGPGISQISLARKYGVESSSIRKILSRVTWRHI